MMLTSHFSLDEMLASQRASREGWSEQWSPSEAVVANLTTLANQLEVVRILLGFPLLISSGWRCPRLNEAVGGARESAHLLGLAADFTAPGFGNPIAICNRLGATKNLEFDQIIYEYGSWCHFGLSRTAERRQLLSKFAGNSTYFVGIIPKPLGEG